MRSIASKANVALLNLPLAMMAFGLIFLVPGCEFAWFMEDLEKPKPDFSREGSKAVSKLIPRGKNTSVKIYFEAKAGELSSITGVDFDTARHPMVDYKDFRSALFELKLGKLSPGQEVDIVVGSDFFTTATEFWTYNGNRDPPWNNVGAQAFPKKEVYVDLVLRVKDGGSFDSDGKENGELTLVGGPRDSFWGYALGTLFIRFFGVFMVLIALMIGMIFFGKLITYLETRKQPKIAQDHTPSPQTVDPKPDEVKLTPELAAAVALTIELETTRNRPRAIVPAQGQPVESCSWVQQGRELLMETRLSAFQRMKR